MVQAGCGGPYNANSAKLILSAWTRERGWQALDAIR